MVSLLHPPTQNFFNVTGITATGRGYNQLLAEAGITLQQAVMQLYRDLGPLSPE